jgi:transposase
VKEEADLPESLNRVNLNAAGIDIGAGSHYVAVPEDRDADPVRCFDGFTEDLQTIADWLTTCSVDTVAMESTGVYWIPLMEELERRGFEVLLVDPHKLKNVPGRAKTDVLDCQWLQRLHSYGLLTGAFRPAPDICALRSYLRQRQMLISRSGDHVRHMHKALTQMNLKLSEVISDLTGTTGMKIIREILAGERDPAKLAKLRHGGCKRDEATIAKALTGHWRDEHLFALRQAVELYDCFQEKIAACDQEIVAKLGTFGEIEERPPLDPTRKKKRVSHPFAFDAHSELHRITGVDLTEVPGLGEPVVMTILSEIGLDMSKWRHEKAFSSWLGLCPGSKVTGGKRLSGRSKPCANRAAVAFRLAAYAVQHSKSYLGAWYRRQRARLGAPKAITATAHKMACLVYVMLRDRMPYIEKGMDYHNEQYRRRALGKLKRNARQLGYQLLPLAEPAPVGA